MNEPTTSATPQAPRVSVIVPAFNSEHYVAAALDSILQQTHAVDEILVIDDGSTDDTAARVQPYTERGVRLLRQENQGVSATRNRGIRETHGDWIAFLDADDVWEPHKIATQLQAVADDSQRVLVSSAAWFWNVDADQRSLMRFGAGAADLRREITVRNVIGNTSLVLVRRDIIEELGGFDTRLRFGEDWEMWIRIVERGTVRVLDEPLLLYRWHAASNSRFREWKRYDVLEEISRAAIERLEPASLRPELHRRRRAYAHAGRAAFAIARGLPRRVQLRHALAALAVPGDDTRQRCGALVHAVLGSTLYRWLRPGTRP